MNYFMCTALAGSVGCHGVFSANGDSRLTHPGIESLGPEDVGVVLSLTGSFDASKLTSGQKEELEAVLHAMISHLLAKLPDHERLRTGIAPKPEPQSLYRINGQLAFLVSSQPNGLDVRFINDDEVDAQATFLFWHSLRQFSLIQPEDLATLHSLVAHASAPEIRVAAQRALENKRWLAPVPA